MTSFEASLIVVQGWTSHQFSGVNTGSVYRMDFSRLKADEIAAVTIRSNEGFMKHLAQLENMINCDSVNGGGIKTNLPTCFFLVNSF